MSLSIYKDTYKFNEFQIGLSYLTGGTGTVLGGYANGKFMDRNYGATAHKIGHTVDKVSGDDLDNFPIEIARARGSWYLLCSSLYRRPSRLRMVRPKPRPRKRTHDLTIPARRALYILPTNVQRAARRYFPRESQHGCCVE